MSRKSLILPASVEELFAFASRMERDSALRYSQMAELMGEHNNQELAELFRRMAEIEWLHVYNVNALGRELQADAQPQSPPPLSAGHGEVSHFEDMHYLHHPHHALTLARSYEEYAMRFYTELADAIGDEAIRNAALSLAAEEETHIAELNNWLRRYPEPAPGWDEDPDPPIEAE